tara:strand:+ start:439 stop:1113 length:675 start_codon:yes stop_codon:yes gene_type:complete
MLQKIDKKKYIFFYLIIFIILSSIHNSNFRYNNFFSVKKIDVIGLNKSNSLLLEKKLVNFIGYNIFTLERESFKFINSINFIKDYNVRKIYPNQIKVYLEPVKAISVVKHFNKLEVLGNNGKIIDLENLPMNVPKVTGINDIKKVFQTLKLIDKSNFDIESIDKIEFFPSERIDIEFRNEKKIRFPINYTIDNLNFALRLLDDDKYNNSKILDLRIPNKVITYD